MLVTRNWHPYCNNWWRRLETRVYDGMGSDTLTQINAIMGANALTLLTTTIGGDELTVPQ